MKPTVETVKLGVIQGRIESMSTLKIADFLEARIAEDKQEALDAPKMSDVFDVHRATFTPALRARVLAECAAKRAIIHAAENCETYGDQVTVLRALATAHKDHPDYRQEWAL